MKPTATGRLIAAGTVLVWTASAMAASDPALVCQSSKLKTAGKYGACRLQTESKAVKASASPDYAKCDDKFSTSWGNAEAHAGTGVCPTEGDQAVVGTRVTTHASAISTLLSGGVPVNPYFPDTGQSTSYGTGSDGDLQSGALLGYQDNGDGTITDRNTGLVWEKKVGGASGGVGCIDETGSCANPHHGNNAYTWTVGGFPSYGSDYDGTVVTIFLEQLNNRCNDDVTDPCTIDSDCTTGPCGFAGHRDWRLPNRSELLSIVNFEVFNPAISTDFNGAMCGAACLDIDNPACSCTRSDFYWTSSTHQPNASVAWLVGFDRGDTWAYFKTYLNPVRAVRAGT